MSGIGSQVRLAIVPTPEGFETRPIGLDNTAVMMTAAAAPVDAGMLVEILPRIEAAVIRPPEPFEQEDDTDEHEDRGLSARNGGSG